MNRCLALALVIVVVSSTVNELHDAVDSLLEETDLGIMSFFSNLQAGSTAQGVWDSLLWWSWGSEEVGATRRRKKPINTRGILKPKK